MRKWIVMTVIAISMTSCFTASLITVATAPQGTMAPPATTTTTVTHRNTTTVNVQPVVCDMSYFFNLEAVAAAFAQSRTVWDFEQTLNSSSYMINNLDLNGDGYVDYIRVLELVNGFQHTFLLQACLAPGVFQDVATIICNPFQPQGYVEIIGAMPLYGNAYIIRPVFTRVPLIYQSLSSRGYSPWCSPYCAGQYPHPYQPCQTVYYSHYCSYVTTYLSGHRYFSQVHYPPQPTYGGYSQDVRNHTRNDYYNQHPENQFSRRNAGVTNARSLTNGSSQRETVPVVNDRGSNKNTNTNTNTNTKTNTNTRLNSNAKLNTNTSTTTRVNTSTGRTRTTTTTTTTQGRNTTTTTTTTRSGGGHR